jgi:hypothetical protein
MRSPIDAKLNPLPGDVLQKGRTWRRVKETWERFDGTRMVRYEARNESKNCVSARAWLAWAADADVLHVQQEGTDAA